MNKTSWRLNEAVRSYGWLIVGGLVALFLASFISWQLGFFSLLFMAAAWWVWEQPERGFRLLIIMAPLLPMLKITQTIATATLIKDVIILTLFMRQWLWPLVRQTLPYRRAVLTMPVVCLLIWTAVEAGRAENVILGVLRARDILLYALLYFGLLYLPQSGKIIKQRLNWWLVSAAIVLALAMYQWWWAYDSAVLRFDPVRQVWMPRLSSLLAHPSIFGQYVAALALLGGSLALWATNKKQAAGWILAVIITLPFIWLTYSRAVWIGLVVGAGATLGAFGWRQIDRLENRISWFKIGAALMAMLVLGLVLLYKFTPAELYVKSFVDPSYASNEERLEFLSRLIAPMSNWEALFGQGLGEVVEQNFRQNKLGVYDIAVGNSRGVQLTKNSTLVDNQYLKTLVEMGLVGLLIYGWIFWRLMRASLELTRHSSQISRVIGLWGIGFGAAFIVQAFFIDIWDIWPTNAMFWVVAGLVGASDLRAGKNENQVD